MTRAKKSRPKLYRLEVVFPVSNMNDWESGNKRVSEAVGKPCDGAGTGFGERDMEWCGLSQKKAEALEAKVLKSGVPGIRARVDKETHDGEESN